VKTFTSVMHVFLQKESHSHYSRILLFAFVKECQSTVGIKALNALNVIKCFDVFHRIKNGSDVWNNFTSLSS